MKIRRLHNFSVWVAIIPHTLCAYGGYINGSYYDSWLFSDLSK
jgi:hypothetical protein